MDLATLTLLFGKTIPITTLAARDLDLAIFYAKLVVNFKLIGNCPMRAAMFYAQEDLRIEDIAEPEPGPGEVKLRNAYVGICGSDLHMFYSPVATGHDLVTPHPLTGALPPQILGHEFSGFVVGLGEGVKNVAVGDRVAVWPIYYCGTCAACVRGLFNVCRSVAFHGLSAHGGGMSEFTTVAASKLHVLPPNVDLRLGALVEPMAVGWHAVRQSGVKPGQSALIIGAGPIGIGLWFALRAHGVSAVVISEPNAARRADVSGIGAQFVVDPLAGELDKTVASVTKGRGVDVAFDAAGVAPAVDSGLAQLAAGGRLVIVAIHESGVDLNPASLVMSETAILGALAYLPEDFDAVIQAMSAGLYSPDGWVSEIALDELVETFATLRAGEATKVLVRLAGSK